MSYNTHSGLGRRAPPAPLQPALHSLPAPLATATRTRSSREGTLANKQRLPPHRVRAHTSINSFSVPVAKEQGSRPPWRHLTHGLNGTLRDFNQNSNPGTVYEHGASVWRRRLCAEPQGHLAAAGTASRSAAGRRISRGKAARPRPRASTRTRCSRASRPRTRWRSCRL